MQSVLGGVLLAGSFAGLCFWDKRFFKLKKEIIPLHVCACVVCVLFVFGLFHLLLAGALLLTMFGLAGLAFGFRSYTWIIRGNLLKTAAVCGACIWLLWKLYDSQGVMFASSNFSHYGPIAKYLLMYHTFPDKNTSLFDFYAYPPGTALFIYWGGRLLGRKAVYLVTMQTFLGLCSVTTLLASGKRRLSEIYIFLYTGVFFICAREGGNRAEELLVDVLLASLVIAAFFIATEYSEDETKAIVSLTPVLTLIVFVKNSGLFFAMFVFVYWLIVGKHTAKKMLCFLSFSGALLLWNIHVKIAFAGCESSENALSLSYWMQMFMQKDSDVFRELMVRFGRAQITFNNGRSFIVLYYIIWMLIIFILSRKTGYKYRKIMVLNTVLMTMYISYQIMLLMMYLFSFTSGQAQILSGYSRFNITALMILYGGMAITILCCPEIFRREKMQNAGVVCAIAFLTLATIKDIRFDLLGTKREQMDINGRAHQQFEYIKEKAHIEENLKQKLLIYVSEEEDSRFYSTYYLSKVAQYVFWSEHIQIVTAENVEELGKGDADWVILYIPDSEALEQAERIADNKVIICNWDKDSMDIVMGLRQCE